MKKIYLIISAILIVIFVSIFFTVKSKEKTPSTHWNFQSIDTMKYSRDLSREKLNDPLFDKVINDQIKDIADTGATHVAIATPYDEEFYPILERWVIAARKNNLKVWFRGNWSGWEGWFDYSKIDRQTHITKTQEFILKHSDLFEDGDVFTGCPECENGGPGDPRMTGDVKGHRKFLIDEYNVTKASFIKINKNVVSNYESMNGDVAKLVMDKPTTKALDGVVTIDHYVSSPEELILDILEISKNSGGKVVLGEFGAPIPDLNGEMTEEEQADYLNTSLSLLSKTPQVIGVSYWTNVGSSTSLWHQDGSGKKAAEVIKSFYTPQK